MNWAGGTSDDGSPGTGAPNRAGGTTDGGSAETGAPNRAGGTTDGGSGETGAANRAGGTSDDGPGATGLVNWAGGSGGTVRANWAGGRGLAAGENRDSRGPDQVIGAAGEGGRADGGGAECCDASWWGDVAVASRASTRKPHQSQYSPDTAELQRGHDTAGVTAGTGRGAWCLPAGRAWPEAPVSICVPQTSQKSPFADSWAFGHAFIPTPDPLDQNRVFATFRLRIRRFFAGCSLHYVRDITSGLDPVGPDPASSVRPWDQVSGRAVGGIGAGRAAPPWFPLR